MKKIVWFLFIVLAASYLPVQAVMTLKWELRTREDFLRGKFSGISASSDGTLTIAPREEKIAAPTEEFYLSILMTEDGITYLGTGHGGKIYRLGKDGKAELYFQANEMDVTCLAQDKKGNLFAGTSPNGKIYRITGKGKADEFFDPAERYIWDLIFADSGNMLAAVGERGGVYEISPQGEGKLIFKAEDNHILCLKKIPNGEIIAGSGGKGLIYRLARDGKVSVVYETPYEEVRRLVIDREGMIYAAVSGTPVSKTRTELSSDLPVRAAEEVTITVSAASPTVAQERQPRPASEVIKGKDGGALYVVSSSGLARLLWSSTEEMVYSLVLADSGLAIFGTGNGRIYSVDKEAKSSLLLQISSEQVFELLPFAGRIRVLGNNPCYLGDILPEQGFSGEYLSPVLDAKVVSTWGKIVWQGEVLSGTTLQLQTRTGNTAQPNTTWSEWSPPYQKTEEQILSPKARFLQVKLILKSQSARQTPALNRIEVFYLQANMAPNFTRFELLKPNEVFLKIPDQEDVIMGVDKYSVSEPARKKDDQRLTVFQKKAERKGFQTIIWDCSDENGDDLDYSVYLRKDGEKDWRLLQRGLGDGIYAFDTLAFPDGTYFVKIIASDLPSNPPGTELQAEKISRPFVIDNSLPVIKNFVWKKTGPNTLEIEFDVEDSYSWIDEVKYLIRPGEWQVVRPVDGLADSKFEKFKFTVKLPLNYDNLITIRARDSFGNIGVFRQVF